MSFKISTRRSKVAKTSTNKIKSENLTDWQNEKDLLQLCKGKPTGRWVVTWLIVDKDEDDAVVVVFVVIVGGVFRARKLFRVFVCYKYILWKTARWVLQDAAIFLVKICNFIMMGGFFLEGSSIERLLLWSWVGVVCNCCFLVYLLLKRVPNLGEIHNLVVMTQR